MLYFLLILNLFLFFLVIILFVISRSKKEPVSKEVILPPKLTNNPSYDSVMTELNPYLSFFNSESQGEKTYQIEISENKDFNLQDKIKYEIKQSSQYITEQKINEQDALSDKKQYYWRVRTLIGEKKSNWATSRFFVNMDSSKKAMNLSRISVKKVISSDGYNAGNIIDYDDPGLLSFWQSPPPWEDKHNIIFDFGSIRQVSRVWILSNPETQNPNGWLKDFNLYKSNNQKSWQKITSIKNNDTFRNIIDINPVRSRYIKLEIKEFIGYAAQINEVIFYSPTKYPVFKTPKEDYVLVVGNEHNGFTFTDLAKNIESLGYKTITIPFYEISLEILNKLSKKPFAIVLSGNNADYPDLPMFEYAGEFEIIRNSSIPILGICAGHQFLAMAYGYSRARSMGWSDISAIQSRKKITKIKITKNDLIFQGINNEFSAPEVHSWSIVHPAD